MTPCLYHRWTVVVTVKDHTLAVCERCWRARLVKVFRLGRTWE